MEWKGKNKIIDHFEGALVVECVKSGIPFYIDEALAPLYTGFNGYLLQMPYNYILTLWDQKLGFAKIIEYKTKATILKDNGWEDSEQKETQTYTMPIINFDDIEILKGIKVPDGMEIDKVIFKKIEKELPNTWEEYLDNYCDNLTHEIHEEDWTQMPDKYKALRKLELLRDCYNDGWRADWTTDKVKYYIRFISSKALARSCSKRNFFLNFKTAELRDKFLENFKDIIEIAKPLL